MANNGSQVFETIQQQMEKYDLIKVIRSTGETLGEPFDQPLICVPSVREIRVFLSSGCREGHIRMLRPG